ncbi:UNVERIFIED_CONTAM: hypothetical protein GTU68_055070 [Idotea baltica]|nr:hypothetical protein [Idotea baltica]
MDKTDFSKNRKEYLKKELLEKDIKKDPFLQFNDWYSFAENNLEKEVNAMCLSTSSNNQVSSRMVLLKKIISEGFIFYTNYESRKSNEQIRIEGQVSKISEEDSRKYFLSRPKGSQLGAIASKQSSIAFNREEIDFAYDRTLKQYKDTQIEYPENWGGFIVKPNYFEFWQGRENRMHDRLSYMLDSRSWKINRLYP